MTQEEDRYWIVESLRCQIEEEAQAAAGGLHLCPTCGNRTVRVSFKPTRNYGGGTDTLYECENPLCAYAEVCV